jgi:hypothetical protein
VKQCWILLFGNGILMPDWRARNMFDYSSELATFNRLTVATTADNPTI